MLTRAGLERDVRRRITLTQELMQVEGLGAVIIVGRAGPGEMELGGIRYLANVHIWSGMAYLVLGLEDPDPWVEIEHSEYQAVWTRNETTTLPSRVERVSNSSARTAQVAREYAQQTKRIGIVNQDRLLSIGEHRKLSAALEGYEVVDVTESFNAIRQIKSVFELEAMQENGAILDASLDVFREHAHVGARYWEVCAATEAYVKAQGAFWGRTKLSLDITPYTVPPPRDREMMEDDIINFEIVYESPWGYWLEMTTIFSFRALPADEEALLEAYLQAVDASSAVARAGNRLDLVSEANDRTLRDLGYAIAGKHTPDCHSIGLGSTDGPNSIEAPDFVLKENMVLSFHPGTVLENSRGFLISDNFLVTTGGAFRLSPHHAHRYHLLLEK